jgi:hypothetical protein
MPEQQEKETTHLFATIGARTERGGWIAEVTTKLGYRGLMLARVGDIVRYEDGTEATINDGAGIAATWEDKPFALVGSRLSNGDRISETLQDGMGIDGRPDKPIPGLFDPSFVYQADDYDGSGRANA